MAPFWQELRSGRWLTAERTRAYSLILLALYVIAIVGWIALSDGLVDRNGKPIGTDFSSFYAAGSLVLDGRAGDVYNMAAHYAREQQIFGPATPYYGWLYPPIFLLVATPLALLPYALALIVWQSATFALYLASSPRSCARRGATVARSPGSGCRSPRPSPPSSSISVTARTAFSPRDCSGRRCWRCRGGRFSPACCSACSPTSRNSAF